MDDKELHVLVERDLELEQEIAVIKEEEIKPRQEERKLIRKEIRWLLSEENKNQGKLPLEEV
jgi:hypothetical protein